MSKFKKNRKTYKQFIQCIRKYLLNNGIAQWDGLSYTKFSIN